MPQSGILGVHKIGVAPDGCRRRDRGQAHDVCRLTYDHRIVDGRQAVTFLVRIKEFIEDPERIMVEI